MYSLLPLATFSPPVALAYFFFARFARSSKALFAEMIHALSFKSGNS
jgi:hypothetical protein